MKFYVVTVTSDELFQFHTQSEVHFTALKTQLHWSRQYQDFLWTTLNDFSTIECPLLKYAAMGLTENNSADALNVTGVQQMAVIIGQSYHKFYKADHGLYNWILG